MQNIVEVYEHTLHLGYAMQIYIHCSVSVGDVIESLWLGLFDLNGNFVVITIRNTPGTKLPAMCDIGNVWYRLLCTMACSAWFLGYLLQYYWKIHQSQNYSMHNNAAVASRFLPRHFNKKTSSLFQVAFGSVRELAYNLQTASAEPVACICKSNLPFVVLSDVCFRPDVQACDIGILIEYMNVVIRRNSVQRLLHILVSTSILTHRVVCLLL